MLKRLSMVDGINVNSTASSSLIQIGDSVRFSPRSKALAAQKEYPIYSGDEGDYDPFEAFSMDIPDVQRACKVNMTTYNEVPLIKAGKIRILGIAASSMLQIGSTQYVDSESRVENFRHFFFPPDES